MYLYSYRVRYQMTESIVGCLATGEDSTMTPPPHRVKFSHTALFIVGLNWLTPLWASVLVFLWISVRLTSSAPCRNTALNLHNHSRPKPERDVYDLNEGCVMSSSSIYNITCHLTDKMKHSLLYCDVFLSESGWGTWFIHLIGLCL